MKGRLTVIFGLKSAFIEANFEANFEKNFVHSKKFPNFVTKIKHGALAHLARAFDWQSRGDEFESRMLHKNKRALKINLLDCDFQCFFRLFSLFSARFEHAADAPGVSDIEGRITEAGS